MAEQGVVYVVYGPKAAKALRRSLCGLWQHNDVQVAVVVHDFGIDGLGPDDGVTLLKFPGPVIDNVKNSRWAKVNMLRLVRERLHWKRVLYLDADTVVRDDVMAPFQMVEDGWDIVLAPSVNQGDRLLAHIGADELEATLSEIGNAQPLQLQAGVMWFDVERCAAFFDVWREEWKRYQDQDQAAFLRALHREPMKVMLLDRAWNSQKGSIIEHAFGTAR